MSSPLNNTPGSAAAPSSYHPFIDGLRALAVLAVMLYHLNAPWLPGGFAGVDVFFVISGFIVSAAVAQAGSRGFGSFMADFYTRRMRRILPALLVCLLVTTFFAALFIPPVWLSAINERSGLFAFFGLSNWVLAYSGRDYFTPATEYNPYAHTWSLGVEEQFYLLFPLLFFAWFAGRGGRRFSAGLFVVLLAGSVAAGLWQREQDAVAAYFLTPGRLWELAAGVLLYQWIGQRAQPAANTGASTALGLLFAALLLAALWWSPAAMFPLPGALPVVLATLGVIYCLYRCAPGHPLAAVLSARPLLLIGKLSYSLYLWHWPVFVLFRWTCGLQTPLERTAAVALTFLLAALSWRLVETPIRHLPARWRARRGLQLVLGALIVVLCWWAAGQLNQQRPHLSLSEVVRHPELWYPQTAPGRPELPGCNAEPEYLDVEGGLLLLYRPRNCGEAPAGQPTLFVIGDSHALAYEGLFKQYAMQHGSLIYAYNNGGCPYISLQPWRDIDAPVCAAHSDAALRHLRTLIKPGDVLFLPSLRMPRLADQWGAFADERIEEQVFSARAVAGRERATRAAIEALRPFAQMGVRVVIEAPKPLFKAPPFRCVNRYDAGNPVCAPGLSISRAELERYRQPVLQAMARIHAALPEVQVWDPFPLLCPGQTCHAMRGGKPLFLDADHISGYGNHLLFSAFSQAMALQALGAETTRD